MEEEFARQSTRLAVEEKKWQDAEIAKKKLELEVIRQNELPQQAMEKLT